MQKKILIIEDEKQLSRNISLLLKEENFDVAIANNGQDGLELAKSYNPDLIICDIMMPQMDGYSVLAELNKDKKIKAIPFIFLTAKVESRDFRKGMELGADDYLFKPFQNDELIRAINTRLNKFESIKAVIVKDKNQDTKAQQEKRYTPCDSIFFKMLNTSHIVKIEKIKYIGAANQYSNVVLENNKNIVIRRTINCWEQILPESIFVRIHRKTIINTQYINKIERAHGSNYRVLLKDTVEVFSISKNYLKRIKDVF
ncbi:MAG: response regulator [bacterium]